MRDEFMFLRGDKKYVLYAGLLDEGHARGLKGIDTDLLQVPTPENGQVAIAKATVELADGRTFSGIGDASPDNVGRGIVPHIIRQAECVPLGSEILTRRGWKTYQEAELGEEVLAYDTLADRCRWVPLLGINTFDAAPLVTLASKSFEVSCTPDHSWAVTSQYATKTVLRKCAEFKASDKVVMAAKAESGPLNLSERDAAVLGWLATDGSLRYSYVHDKYGKWGPYPRAYLQQSKQRYVAEIRDLVGDDAVETTDPAGRRGGRGAVSTMTAHRFALRTSYLKHLLAASGLREWTDLTEIVLRLSSVARAAMLDAMLKGDGWRHGDNRNTWVFGTTAKSGVMEAWELLATLEGYALGKPVAADTGRFPARSMRQRRLFTTANLATTHEGAAKVWCPTTPLGTWVMRQNGYISITGNTRAKARALRDAVNVGATAIEELSDGDAEATTQGDERAADQPQGRSASRRESGKVARDQQGARNDPSRHMHAVGDPPKHAAVPATSEDRPVRHRLQKADRGQVDLLRTRALELRGDTGVEKLENRIGKSLEELTRAEATKWIDRLTPSEGTG